MARGRNKTPAERALEVICTMAGVSFEEFQEQLEKSQGDKASKRAFPEQRFDVRVLLLVKKGPYLLSGGCGGLPPQLPAQL